MASTQRQRKPEQPHPTLVIMMLMGRVRRGGYIIFWWKGDHEPRHVHVRSTGGEKLGRVNLQTLKGMDGWTPDRKLISVIEQLKREGRL